MPWDKRPRRPTMKAAEYAPAPNHWKGDSRRVLLWAAMQVLERLGQAMPDYSLVTAPHLDDVRVRDAAPKGLAALSRFREMAEARAEDLIAAQFRREGEALAAALRKHSGPVSPDTLDATLDRLERGWMPVLEKIYADTGRGAGRRTWDALHRQGLVRRIISFTPEESPWMAPIVSFLRIAGAAKVVGITDTTRGRLRRALATGVEAGETIPTLASRITSLFSFMSKERATVIARTETLTAYSMGAHGAAVESGVRMDKVWRANKDARVREAHRKADGQRRSLETPYNVDGEELMFPSDTSLGASAENTIQCRCVSLYVPRPGRR